MGLLVRITSVVALLSLASCWSPVFDADVSLAAVTASKLSLDADFSVSLSTYGDSSAFLAVPEAARPPARMALASLGNTGAHLEVFQKSGGQWSSTGYGMGYGYDAPLAELTAATVHVGRSTGAFSVALYLPTSGYGRVEYEDSSTSYPVTGSLSPSVLGVASLPSPSLVTDAQMYVLSKSGAVYTLGLNVSNNGTAFVTPGGSAWTGAVTGLSNGSGWLAVNAVPATPIGYLTHYEKNNGQYTTQMFNDTQVLNSWTRTDRVVAVLSNQKLLTRDGGFYNVCSLAGDVEYSFPAGALQFAGEFHDGSAYRCWFTQVLSDDASQGSNTGQHVRAYSVATSNLPSLK